MLPELTPQEKDRYDRHLRIPEMGEEGQRKLKAASALIVGVGGLGSPLAMYMAAAGFGRIGLVDSDVLALSNLQRQIIHGEANLNEPKVESAARRLHDLNSAVQLDLYPERFTEENAERLAAPYDLLMDGTDNLATRNVINRIAVKLGKPYIYGGVFQFDGQMSVFDARRGPCYNCLFAEAAPKWREDRAARRVQRPARGDRHLAGHRSGQMHPRHRRTNDRQTAPL